MPYEVRLVFLNFSHEKQLQCKQEPSQYSDDFLRLIVLWCFQPNKPYAVHKLWVRPPKFARRIIEKIMPGACNYRYVIAKFYQLTAKHEVSGHTSFGRMSCILIDDPDRTHLLNLT